MPPFPLLWPAIALAALTFTVWFVLAIRRFQHRTAHPPQPGDLTTSARARSYYEPVELPANNLVNLFEMPVLFYVVILLLIVSQLGNDVQVMLAWAFVVLRTLHSVLHLRGQLRPRFFSYLLSVAVLLAMWIGFTVDAVRVAQTYAELNAQMGPPL